MVDPARKSTSDDATRAREVSSGARAGETRVPLEQQKTVISNCPVDTPPSEPLTASQLGRSLAGRTLGHFRLEQLVGGGGMGAVYRATDLALGRSVAVKVVASDQTDEDTLRRFQNEAQSAARLDHPNIATVYESGEVGGVAFIASVYCTGPSLSAQCPLTERERTILDLVAAGHANKEVAFELGISERTIYADWEMARRWLSRRLEDRAGRP